MVKIAAVQQRNALYAKEQHESGLVCVFHGATSGIGASTLEQLADILHEPTFYVLGRSASRFARQRAAIESINPGCKVNFIEIDVSLLANIDNACQQIAAVEKKVDCLYMSAGLIPLNGAQFTTEGLEMCFSLSYYSRMRLVYNLLPLLHRSARPRILSVLNGSKEGPVHEDDIGLARRWAPLVVVNHVTTMTTLAFEHLAKSEKGVTFLHAYPGLVQTDIFARLTPLDSAGVLWRFTLASIRNVVTTLMRFFGMTAEECGARQAFLLTGGNDFGPGNVWRINSSSEHVSKPGALEGLRERGWQERVWDFTLQVFEKALSSTTGA